jgi:hypothetical protein
MPPFTVPKVRRVKPFGQGVDGVVGKIDAANHRNKFGKPTVPKRRTV